MDRRTALRRTAAASAVLLAGCTGARRTQDTMNVTNVDFYEGDDGYLTVSVIVANVGNQAQSGKLLVHATLNGEAMTRVRELSLGAHETATVTITYDVKMAAVKSFDVDAEITQN